MSAPVRELQPNALTAFMSLLQDVLEQHGTVTLRAVKKFRSDGLPTTRTGETTFASNRVSVRRDLSPTLFLHTVTHELVHLQRGPAWSDEVEAEETLVEDQAQTLLYGTPRPVTVRTENRRRHLSVVR